MTDHPTSPDLVRRIARAAIDAELRIVAAESLTSGCIAARLGAGPEAASWFTGAVVAYQEPVKFEVLGVDEGPVVTQRCSEQMARGVLRLLRGDVAVAVTGVGGPGPSEGRPAGTVFITVASAGRATTTEHSFKGPPEEVLDQTCVAALGSLVEHLTAQGASV